MIADITMVEQRHRAVLEVLEQGAKVTDVAVRYGVDRKTKDGPPIAGSL